MIAGIVVDVDCDGAEGGDFGGEGGEGVVVLSVRQRGISMGWVLGDV